MTERFTKETFVTAWLFESKSECYGVHQKDYIDNLKQTVTDLHAIITATQKQVDDLSTDAGSQRGHVKIPDLPTFTDSESKQDLKMWINQINLYAAHIRIVTDKQKIMLVLTRLHNSAAKYIGNYFEKLLNSTNLDSWKDFEKKLNDIYGQKDDVAKLAVLTLAQWPSGTFRVEWTGV